MVKKRLIALGVSVAAITAVAGAGFAGWTFTSEAKQEANLGVNITAAYSFGTVAIDTDAPDTVVLDQSGVTLAKTGALGTAITDVTATWTVNTVSYTDATTAGLTYTVNVYVKGTADSGLAKYVVANTPDTTKTAPARDGYVGYVYTLTPEAGDITTSGNDTVVTLTLANPLDYTTSKPDTFDEYQTMVNAIEGTAKADVATDTAYDVAATSAPVIFEFVVTKTTA